MCTDTELALLKNFFGGYFNQDWDYEADNWQGVVSLYANAVNQEDRTLLGNTILAYADGFDNDEELEKDLSTNLCSDYLPTADEMSVRVWLQAIASQLLGG